LSAWQLAVAIFVAKLNNIATARAQPPNLSKFDEVLMQSGGLRSTAFDVACVHIDVDAISPETLNLFAQAA
jgi:hypothetical protein